MKVTLIEGQMCNVFLIECSKTIVVDAGANVEEILKLTKKVDFIFLTHCHFDHIYYLNDYISAFKGCKIVLGENGVEKLKDNQLNGSAIFEIPLNVDVDESLLLTKKEGDCLEIEEENVFLELFGHTNCSLGLKIQNYLFSGDVIFNDGIGRYDLPTGSFEQTIQTQKRLRELQDIDFVCCGHGTCPFNLKIN